MPQERIPGALEAFRFEGTFEGLTALRSGNINSTFRLTFRLPTGEAQRYALQRINSFVFKNPRAVMRNMEQVCEHLRRSYLAEGIDPRRRMIELAETVSGEKFFMDGEGCCWRAYRFIEGATAYDSPQRPGQFREAGRGFGEFQRRLRDLPVNRLIETIPNFHNTPKRFADFAAAVKRDRAGRSGALKREISFLYARQAQMGGIAARIRAGALPLRVTHNDTKSNNVMIDDETGRALCVIDLDTVMPGTVLYDFGDAIRFGASAAAEDERDLSKVSLDMELFGQFSEGYLSEAAAFLLPEERRLLPLGVVVITCEQAMRFLADYIDGDPYYKIDSPDHNLVRARAQMRLLEDMEAKYGQMRRVVAR